MVTIKKKFVAIGVLIVVAIIALAVSLTLLLRQEKSCKTPACKKMAEHLKNYMDEKIDPCRDFYEFTCGKFMRRYNIPPDVPYIGGPFYDAEIDLFKELLNLVQKPDIPWKSKAVDNVVKLYKSCVYSMKKEESDNALFIKNKIKTLLGGSPLFGEYKYKTFPPFHQSIAEVIRDLDQNFIFSIQILPDINNASQLTLSLYPELDEFMSTKRHVIKPPSAASPPFNSDSETIIRDVICIIDPQCSHNNIDDFIKKLLSNELHSPPLPDYLSYNAKRLHSNLKAPESIVFKSMTVRELNMEVPDVDWLKFLQTVFKDSGYGITENTSLVTIPSIIRSTVQQMQSDKQFYQSYLSWKIIQKWGPIMVNSILVKLTQYGTAETSCLSLTNQALGFALGSVYHYHHLSSQTQDETTKIVLELKKAFTELLKENTWMDDETKDQALLKINNMVESISTPDWAQNPESLDKYYEKMGILDKESFRKSINAIGRFGMLRKVSTLVEPFDRKNFWPTATSAETNAFYFHNTNAMMFPTGILTFPFFESGRPSSMNFGSFGYIAGHEITHGFDNTGSLRDENGSIKNWWSASSKQKFDEKAKCFVNQYDNIRETSVAMSINGTLTLGENIADNGGIREAYRAFKNYQKVNNQDDRLPGLTNYNQDQLFFLSAGFTYCTITSPIFLANQILTDEHSPNRHRVTVPFQNTKDFADAFGCAANTRMNPSRKCQIW